VKDMDLEYNNGLMALYMKVFGRMENLPEKEN
jgi:hypothetical protein